jgi:hypothetical protein
VPMSFRRDQGLPTASSAWTMVTARVGHRWSSSSSSRGTSSATSIFTEATMHRDHRALRDLIQPVRVVRWLCVPMKVLLWVASNGRQHRHWMLLPHRHTVPLDVLLGFNFDLASRYTALFHRRSQNQRPCPVDLLVIS